MCGKGGGGENRGRRAGLVCSSAEVGFPRATVNQVALHLSTYERQEEENLLLRDADGLVLHSHWLSAPGYERGLPAFPILPTAYVLPAYSPTVLRYHSLAELSMKLRRTSDMRIE